VIERIRAPRGDNYSYVIYDEPGGVACLVDPVAVDAVRSFLQEQSLDPVNIVNTHGHGDHTSGNAEFRSADVICHSEDKSRVDDPSRTVEGGETLSIGSLPVDVLHTPGHTKGSICLQTPSALVAGDTVFLSGCGNPKFGGDTRQLYRSFKNKIRPLDKSLTLCPGHDYARRNLNFARSVDPENNAVDKKLSELDRNGEPESTLEDEHAYNPFFRYDDPALKKQLNGISSSSSDWDVFCYLREQRNNW
jgi:hydroxyacylglutathione hydrolase